MIKYRKVNKKFLLLIFIIVSTIITGLVLTLVSDGEVSNSRLRGTNAITSFRPDSDLLVVNSTLASDLPLKSSLAEEFLNQTTAPEAIIFHSKSSADLINNSTWQSIGKETTILSSISPLSNTIVLNNSSWNSIPENETETFSPSSLPLNQPADKFLSFSQPLKDQFHNILFRQFSIYWKATGDFTRHSSPSNFVSDPIDRFHSSLQYGEICSDILTKNSKVNVNSKMEIVARSFMDPSALPPIYQSILQFILGHEVNLFIEYNRLNRRYQRPLAFFISSHHSYCYSILFDSSVGNSKVQPKSAHVCGASRYPHTLNPPSNVFVSTPPTSDVEKKVSWSGVFDCFQLINSFEDLISEVDMIPFEYEVLLGQALCRCNITILPAKLPLNSFFSYWESVDSLIKESMINVEHICSIDINRTETEQKRMKNAIENYWVLRREVDRMTPFSAEVLLSGSLNFVSRFHLSAMLVSPFQNYSSDAFDESFKVIKARILASVLPLENTRRDPVDLNHLKSKSTSSNSVNSMGSFSTNSTSPVSTFSQYSQNLTARRRLFDTATSPHKLESSKKIFPFLQPPKMTYWGEISQHHRDEFDDWLNALAYKLSPTKQTINDDDQ